MVENNGFKKGWTTTKLGKVVSFEYGKGLREDRRDQSGSVPVYGSNGIVGHHSKALVNAPCIVVGRKGTAGAVHLSRVNSWPIDTTYYVIPPAEIDISFLYHLLSSLQLGRLDKSTAIPGLNRNDAYELEVEIPPLPEQQRIVLKIEELFTRLDAGVEELRRAKARLQRYRQSVLKAAVTGELTREWREAHPPAEPASALLQRILAERRARWEDFESRRLLVRGNNPKNKNWLTNYSDPINPTMDLEFLPDTWSVTTLDQLSFHVTSGSRGWAKYYSYDGSLFIRVGNFIRQDVGLDLGEIVFVREPASPEAFRTKLDIGDLLITITADVGMVAVVDEKDLNDRNGYINQHVCLVRLINAGLAKFVAYMCASELIQKQFRDKEYGATKKGLNLTDVKTITIPFPSLDEQGRIVEKIERRLSVADEIETEIDHALARAARLRQSILKRAFEGKLS